jgi:hypothetical protein
MIEYKMGRHVFLVNNSGPYLCKYCGFYLSSYDQRYDVQIVKMIKCLSDEEKIIKDIIE